MIRELPPGPAHGMACRWSKDQKQTLLLWDPGAQEWHAVSATQEGIPQSWRREATMALAEEKLRGGGMRHAG